VSDQQEPGASAAEDLAKMAAEPLATNAAGRAGLGLAGNLARLFIHSKLTPLILGGSILLGIGAVALLPREEEPQIVVPMIDVFVQMPGASPQEVEQRVTGRWRNCCGRSPASNTSTRRRPPATP
jgi:hypothetical protein